MTIVSDGGRLFGRQPWLLRWMARDIRCDESVANERAGMLGRTIHVVGGWTKAIWCWSSVVPYTEKSLADLASMRSTLGRFDDEMAAMRVTLMEVVEPWRDYNAQVARWEGEGGRCA